MLVRGWECGMSNVQSKMVEADKTIGLSPSPTVKNSHRSCDPGPNLFKNIEKSKFVSLRKTGCSRKEQGRLFHAATHVVAYLKDSC